MIAIVHSIYSQSVHALALNAGSIDNDAGRYCMIIYECSISLLYNLTPCSICQPLQVMPPLRRNQDLYIITTSSASQVLIDTWVHGYWVGLNWIHAQNQQ